LAYARKEMKEMSRNSSHATTRTTSASYLFFSIKSSCNISQVQEELYVCSLITNRQVIRLIVIVIFIVIVFLLLFVLLL
jgi:hypothetical protein